MDLTGDLRLHLALERLRLGLAHGSSRVRDRHRRLPRPRGRVEVDGVGDEVAGVRVGPGRSPALRALRVDRTRCRERHVQRDLPLVAQVLHDLDTRGRQDLAPRVRDADPDLVTALALAPLPAVQVERVTGLDVVAEHAEPPGRAADSAVRVVRADLDASALLVPASGTSDVGRHEAGGRVRLQGLAQTLRHRERHLLLAGRHRLHLHGIGRREGDVAVRVGDRRRVVRRCRRCCACRRNGKRRADRPDRSQGEENAQCAHSTSPLSFDRGHKIAGYRPIVTGIPRLKANVLAQTWDAGYVYMIDKVVGKSIIGPSLL